MGFPRTRGVLCPLVTGYVRLEPDREAPQIPEEEDYPPASIVEASFRSRALSSTIVSSTSIRLHRSRNAAIVSCRHHPP